MKRLIVGAVCLAFVRAYNGNSTDYLATITGDITQGLDTMKKAVNGWDLSLVPVQYRGLIAESENARGIPSGMLARLLWQESHYRADIINGTTKSAAGAMGIAQFMPATAAELGINPLDPVQAIPAAALYLSRQYRATGNWAEALAAYNWGLGNVRAHGIANAPRETVAYYSGILSDLGMA